jgi:hypothetical protein
MKYKKHIATGALAISLLVGGSSVLAATPQDLGIKNVQSVYQKQNKNLKIRNKRKNSIVGTVAAINNTGFTVNVKNLKTKIISSVDVVTDASTIYKKNGTNTTASSLSLGQKVIVAGVFDKTTNILNARTVKIATKPKI